jgi:citrate-Mg2+:H+ or citrate-Ca2+:H+ symporter, CitMHS family
MPQSDLLLTLLGFGMVVTFMVLIMLKKLTPIVALTIVPLAFALVAGFGSAALGEMMLKGIALLAPTGVMLMFAILYFGIMIDAGLFDPVVKVILRMVGGDPLKVVVGTAVLSAVVSLDGDGSTTYMITVASMLPLYRRLGVNVLKLTCVTIMAGGIMNLTPWGGPLARAASALHVEPATIFVPMIPVLLCGLVGVFAVAYYLGLSERRRLGIVALEVMVVDGPQECDGLKRPRLLWVNFALTVALMTGLVLRVAPLPVLFLVGFCIALLVNYPGITQQRQRIAVHGQNVVAVVSVIFAAGVFTGILSGTGMVDAMSKSLLAVIPDGWGPYLAPITALASLPFTFFISNDAFYFGVLPIVSTAAQTYGISGVEMARAALIGQPVHLLSPLVPSTYLLVGLAGVEFGDHQRFTLPWAILMCMLMLAASLVLGIFPFYA